MQFLKKLGVTSHDALIDWDITPAKTYGMFECRGDMDIVRSKDQRYYYFYIDNWQKPARLCLMERGIRHAKVLAHIDAPLDLLEKCIFRQGKTLKEHSYAVDGPVKEWLFEHVIDNNDFSKVHVLDYDADEDPTESGLPATKEHLSHHKTSHFRNIPAFISEHEIEKIVANGDFFESVSNPNGRFTNYLVDPGDNLTVIDMATGLMWQRAGSDHSSFRKMAVWEKRLNGNHFAGYNDWRLPTVEEALSLLNAEVNKKGLHIHRCFATTQGFIYTADRRKPGGYWFVDFRHARVFWAGGTLSGGFGRLCRTV